MMAELFATALMRAQIAAAAAVLFILLVRAPARRLFGARLAYGLWLIAPAAAGVSIFPSMAETLERGAPAAPLGQNLATLLLALWIAGGLVVVGLVALQERAFRHRARRGQAGPAVMGVLWPRVVLPADFATRFTARERDLIQMHERTHIRRGDPITNLAVTAACVLGWCNPMVLIGAAFIRIDQELACDATVLALRGDIRADYAKALLKAQMGAAASPLTCGWATHPLILRVNMLSRREPSQRREIAGFAALTLLALGAVGAVWSVAPRGLDNYALSPVIEPDQGPPVQLPRVAIRR